MGVDLDVRETLFQALFGSAGKPIWSALCACRDNRAVEKLVEVSDQNHAVEVGIVDRPHK